MYIAGEDIKAGTQVQIGSDGKLYNIKSVKIKRIAEKEFIEELKNNPAYNHINIDKEMLLIDEWLKRHPTRQKTRLFVIGWLNRKEVPLSPSNDLPENLRRFFK